MLTEFLKGDLQMIEKEDCDKVEEIVEYPKHTTPAMWRVKIEIRSDDQMTFPGYQDATVKLKSELIYNVA
jgi:hypothetical protein